MNTLSFEGMAVDIELRKKLNSLIALKENIEAKLNDDSLKPLEEEELKNTLEKINEIIGKIRFKQLDSENQLSEGINPHNEESEPIDEGSRPHEDIQKQVPGNFSTEKETLSEVSNQNSKPVKVNASKETEENTFLNRKQEPYIEKGFDPELNDEVFYNSIDKIIDIQKMASFISSDVNLPRGTRQLAKDAEFSLYHGLRDTVNSWFENVNHDTEPYSALADLRLSLVRWNVASKSNTSNTVQELYNRGLESGIKKAGLKKPEHSKDVHHLINRDSGMGPALDKFRDECYTNISKIMMKHIHNDKHALYREKREIDSWLRKQRFQTRLMLKTEVAKIANLGLIESWSLDSDKYLYNYFWDAIVDERTKEISRIRKSGNPYTFDEIAWLWKNQEQLIGKRWQNDAYNQRCSISRMLVDTEFKGNRFSGRESEFSRTL
jgi:hypothetical protein